jgi:hypothetical protein
MAKYYPSTGWYPYEDVDLADFMEEHSPSGVSASIHGTPTQKQCELGNTFELKYV